MKKILVLFTIFFLFSAVNVYAQTMSKYGYPATECARFLDILKFKG